MTTERGTYDDPGGVDAIVATREDELTAGGLDDSAPMPGTEAAGGYGSSLGTTSTIAPTGSGDRLQDAAGGVADRVASSAQERVGTQVDTGLTKAGEMIEQIAGAVRQSGEQLRDQQPQIAGFADTAASQVDRFAQYLRGARAQDIVRETEDFARRQPAVFLGGALAVGLIASRFLKASPQGDGAVSRFGDGTATGDRGRYGSRLGDGSGSDFGVRSSSAGSYAASTGGSSALGSGTGVEHGRA